MAEDFRGPDLKLHRAETHISEYRRLLARFKELQSYVVVADLDLEPGNICWVARGQAISPHDEFAPIIGDAIQNMRAALDLAVCVFARNKNLSDEHIEFITRVTQNEFESTVDKRAKTESWLAHLAGVLKTQVQPYPGGHGHLLHTLHGLSILDKHRLLIPTVFGTSVVSVGINGSHVLAKVGPPDETMVDGSIVARNLVADLPDVKVGQQAAIALTIVFDESCGSLSGAFVDDALIRLYNATRDAIEALRACLP